MRRRRGSIFFFAILMAFAVFASACAGQGGEETQQEEEADPVKGGTLTFLMEQFPEHFQCEKADNNMAWCHHAHRVALRGLYKVTPDFEYVPDLLAEEAVVEEGPPYTVTYTLKDEAVWSDGTPVTAEDIKFTYEVHTNPKNESISASSYEDVESVEVVDEKTAKVTFKQVYVPYRDLFDYIWPKHVLEGEDWDKVWARCVCDPKTKEPIANGPYLLTDFKPNQSITAEPNPEWWGEEGPYLDRIHMPYVGETQTEIQQLRGGEADMIYPSPQPELKVLANLDGIVYDVGAGPSWQHLDFQFKVKPLGELWARQAIAHGIDRQGIVDQLITPIYPEATVLNNLIYVSNQKEYEDHFGIYDFNPEKAEQLLTDNGCKKGNDGIYVCDGKKMSFSYKSTAGNRLRELMFQIIQGNLKDIGIEVRNEFMEDPFGAQGLTGENYDLIQFAWVGSPDPSGGNTIWECEGEQNYQNYCNEEVTELIQSTDQETDVQARVDLYNQADELMAQDVPVLPLWQYPQPMAYKDVFHGFENNTTEWGPFWNIEQVWREDGGA